MSVSGWSCGAAWADEGVRPSIGGVQFGNVGVFLDDISHCSLRHLWQNSSVQFYRRNLPHMQRDYAPHFITFCTKFRLILPDWARDIVLGCCVHDHQRKYRLRVAVVMPDHVHVILTPLTDEGRRTIVPQVEIMKAIKSASAHMINRHIGNHGTIWQEESFDRVVRSSESLDEKVAYVLQNPVRKALVQDWRQYRWTWQPTQENPYAPPATVPKEV